MIAMQPMPLTEGHGHGLRGKRKKISMLWRARTSLFTSAHAHFLPTVPPYGGHGGALQVQKEKFVIAEQGH